MDTSIERIRAKIAELEAKLSNLRIAQVLGEHGALPVAEIAGQIKAAGRDVGKRSVSHSLQAMKKQGLVKSGNGRWMLSKARNRPVPA